MKKVLYMLLALGLSCVLFSCSSTNDGSSNSADSPQTEKSLSEEKSLEITDKEDLKNLSIGESAVWKSYSVTVNSIEQDGKNLIAEITIVSNKNDEKLKTKYLTANGSKKCIESSFEDDVINILAGETTSGTLIFANASSIQYLEWDNWGNEASWIIPEGTIIEDTSSSIEEVPASEPEPSMTPGQSNALRSAKNYLSVMSFSYSGLIKQLEYEKYSTEDATFAANNCGADWNEQATKTAKSYLDVTAFSREGLIAQLEYDGYTHEQAVYGVDSVGL